MIKGYIKHMRPLVGNLFDEDVRLAALLFQLCLYMLFFQSIDVVFGNIEQICTQQAAFSVLLEQAIVADGLIS